MTLTLAVFAQLYDEPAPPLAARLPALHAGALNERAAKAGRVRPKRSPNWAEETTSRR